MTHRAPRLLALGAAAVLALSGCATPGNGDPGVATTYRDRVITQADVTEVEAILRDLGSPTHPGEALTLLLIGPEAVAIAQDLGVEFTEAGLRADALMWMSAMKAPQVEPSPEVLELILQVRSIAYLMNDQEGDGVTQMIALVTDIQENSTTSPRYGNFTLKNFAESKSEIDEFVVENQQGLLGAIFLAYKDVDGFSAISRPEWISGG
jgi:hypothetical protein